MVTGKIVFIKPIEYYGFIVDDETHADVFFHSDDVYLDDDILPGGTSSPGYLNEGERVEFDIEQVSKGPRARNVKRL